MARALIHLLGFLMVWVCLSVPPAALAQDLSGSLWIFSVGNPPQPFPDNTWKIVQGAPGSPLWVDIQRGMGPAAHLRGSYDGKKMEIRVDRQQAQGVYSGKLSGAGHRIEGIYSEARPTGKVTQPFRLTRLDSLSSADPIQISWQQQDDPGVVVCKASQPSAQPLSFSWSLDGTMQPEMTAEVRLTGVTPGPHQITAIGFNRQTLFLTAPQTLKFEMQAPRSWDLPLLLVALAMLGLAALGWGRKKWVKSVEVDLGTARGVSAKKTPAQDDSVLRVRGDGRDETLVQIRGGREAQLRAPDPSPRLLLKKVDAGVLVRAVYLGERAAMARLEVHWDNEVSQVSVAVEPIVLEVQVTLEKRGFETRSYTTRVGGLCGAVAGRIASAGQPVAFASCTASLRIDGGPWSDAVSGQSDHQGNFCFEMPPLLIRVLGVELSEFRLGKWDLPMQSSEPLEVLCAERPTPAGSPKNVALLVPAEVQTWLNSLAEWVGKKAAS